MKRVLSDEGVAVTAACIGSYLLAIEQAEKVLACFRGESEFFGGVRLIFRYSNSFSFDKTFERHAGGVVVWCVHECVGRNRSSVIARDWRRFSDPT